MTSTSSSPDLPSPDGADTSARGVGLSNPELSKGRRRLLDLANRLHSTGVQKDIDLPMIAVIGSQSAGKSSLIESISGITLPRAAGTCTRCPTECKLSYSPEPWKCVVTLRFVTDENGQPLGQVRNIPFGDAIFDKSDVEERIRRAQRAVLNPSTSARSFLDGNDEDLSDRAQLTFSSNCVSLTISGREVADLSFVDLPGLIASVGTGGNAGDIGLVRNLVTSYISKPSCLILLTVTCETDFENQGAYELAKDNDPDGKRTIGVLTKPDRIPAGEEDRWLRFIRNEHEPLENNWYAVKQPDSKALKQGLTWEEARTQESMFFSMTEPWSSLDHMYQKYLRTSNLTERLSVILSDLISKRLPEIQDELQSLIRKTEELMRQLPKPPSSDPLGEVMNLVGTFVRDLERHLEGTPSEGLLQQIRPAQLEFKNAIRGTAPNFKPFEKKYARSRTIPSPSFLSSEEGDPEEQESPDEDEDDDGLNRIMGFSHKSVTRFISERNAIYIDEVFQRADRARTRELPHIYPFVVHETFISEVMEEWPTFARNLFDETHMILTSYVKKLVSKHFANFGRGDLHQRVLLVLTDHIKNRCEKTMAQIDWLIRLETKPFTLNEHYHCDYREKFMAHYKGWRQNDRHSTLMKSIRDYKPSPPPQIRNGQVINSPTGIAKIMSGLLDVGISGIQPADLPKILPADPMEPALVIMADVRAYFQVAYKRFTDNVPLAIDLELVRGLKEGIDRTLYGGLGVSGPDGRRICQELVQEHPSVSARREELQKKWERLYTASQELVHLEV